MASAAAPAAGDASTTEPAAKEKPIVVRVKRKPSQTRPDAFWLEINERPAKKAMLDLSNLSISEPSTSSSPGAREEPRVKKLFVQHIETVRHSEAVQDVLHSLLLADSNTKEIKSKTKEWHDIIKQDKKPDQLRSAARQRHEVIGWDLGVDLFEPPCHKAHGNIGSLSAAHLIAAHGYPVVNAIVFVRCILMITSFEEGAVLCNFLPLIREYLPSAAVEIESDIISLAQLEDSEVYDIYTVKEVDDTNMDDTAAASYPRLQVDDCDDNECYGDDYPYDTDDSNAEDNPLFDYPDELSDDEDGGSDEEDPFGDLNGSDSEYEKEEVEAEQDE
ncbi:hypothetical protein U9M48_005614 [Paspalum notatum var. saurae]|uniref:RNA-directed DNA methylation 4 n=1 Tax=Paspalum notatum var. saurae TaxID=547442 RepID=A0AAQ3SLG0_PASNO